MNREHDPAAAENSPVPARPPLRLNTPPLVVEHTHWSWGLVGFYVSCAGVALGATIGAAGHWFFGSTSAVWIGGGMAAVSSVTTYLTLRAARRPQAGGSRAPE